MTIDAKRKNNLEARAKILKALAHPSRLLIVEELQDGKRCVCELTDMIGADMSTVSRHLSVLKNAGVVADERDGVKIYYELKVPCIMDFLGCIQDVITLQAMAAQAAAR